MLRLAAPRPGWRNGIRGRLKPVCPKGHRGSTPLSGTFCRLLAEARGSAGKNAVVKSAQQLEVCIPWVSGILGFASPTTGLSKRAFLKVRRRGEAKAYVLSAHSLWPKGVVCDHKG